MLHTSTARARARTLALVGLGVLVLGGCGADAQDNVTDTQAADTSSSASPSSARTNAGSEKPASTATPTTSNKTALPEDWRPEEPTVLATGQKVPDDYEPATLEHPARNVPKPVMPPEAKEETEAGAQAFLNYRADAQWYSIQTGDTTQVREITSPDCAKCTEQFDHFDRIFSKGGWAAGGFETEKISPGSFRKRPDGGYNLPVSVTSSGMIVLEENAVIERQHPFDLNDRFDSYIYYENGSWKYLTASPRGSL